MSKQPLDDLFRNAFEEPTEAPSKDLWQRLETRLDDRRAERRRARRIRFLQPGVLVLTVAMLLLAGLAGWYFVKDHRAKISPKPLIFNELGWMEGHWGGEAEGRGFSTRWFWQNDSTLASDGFVFENSSAGPVVPNHFFQKNGSLFYTEKGEVFSVEQKGTDAGGPSHFSETSPTDGQTMRLVRRGIGRFDWFDEEGAVRHEAHFFRKK